MRVHSFHRHREVGDFAPDTGELRIYQRSAAPDPSRPLRGHFAMLDETLVVAFRNDDGHLELWTTRARVPLDDTAILEWCHEAGVSRLTVRSPDRVLVLEYRPDSGFELAGHEDPLPICDAEDFDFGLFISNVANDQERRNRIYQTE